MPSASGTTTSRRRRTKRSATSSGGERTTKSKRRQARPTMHSLMRCATPPTCSLAPRKTTTRSWNASVMRVSFCSARHPTARTSSTAGALRSRSGSSRRRASRPSRSRRIGRMPTASTASCAGRATTSMRERRSRTSGAFQRGCGATPRWPSSSNGYERTTTHFRPTPRRPASTASISTVSTPR